MTSRGMASFQRFHHLRRTRVRIGQRGYASKSGEKSAHALWYEDVVPGMIPIAILGSAVYMGLQLLQTNLSHEKYLEEARARVKALEAEVDALQKEREQIELNPVSKHVSTSRGAATPTGRSWLSWW
ncbi:hypothetical protein JAAARDRAFT_52731 [Jaapia argillacea MUCL 33604]|uniref:Uncharacterized protein n=1 Tax=Jaapia argillacea MUCL 33604 TaxID=933084 RepID=A0A067QF57_9AGAM|nr:hypothetical protein JAAARDRAFT_52731 [Jaapia argillacea MUCL 33604]